MSRPYSRVARALAAQPWAILPERLEAILELVQFRAEGGQLTAEEIRARTGDPANRPVLETRVGPVVVLALHGVIAQRMNLFVEISGGTSTELFGQAIEAALADPEVAAVVIDIDSPGGSVFGVEELAAAIARARAGSKPIVAVADSLAASAAYWIGSQADEFVVTPGGLAGSVGVYMVHEDLSEAEKLRGVKTTLVSAGRLKVAANEFEPLSDDGRAAIQRIVDAYYDLFVKAVARGRGVSAQVVRSDFGEGTVLDAKAAVTAGMADRIETLADTIRRVSSAQGRRAIKTPAGPDAGSRAATPQEPAPPATGQEPREPRLLTALLRAELDAVAGTTKE